MLRSEVVVSDPSAVGFGEIESLDFGIVLFELNVLSSFILGHLVAVKGSIREGTRSRGMLMAIR